jgi:hypothetical protein
MAKRTAKVSKVTPVQPADTPKADGPTSAAPPADPPPSADEIRLHAYLRWEASGKPPGDGVKFWLEAEQDLLQAK